MPKVQLVDGGRFIPTYVGNTRYRFLLRSPTTVHPHVCGEHLRRNTRRSSGRGSSPRMWGTHAEAEQRMLSRRFIPTYVGNTPRRFGDSKGPAVHPHVCGEHSSPPPSTTSNRGSSPRMWGTPFLLRGSTGADRFIPTYVGNTLIRYSTPLLRAVHPHVCGEHTLRTHTTTSSRGSSPRMWGTPWTSADVLNTTRFIPTYVGNTFHLASKLYLGAVHPHVCGEHR